MEHWDKDPTGQTLIKMRITLLIRKLRIKGQMGAPETTMVRDSQDWWEKMAANFKQSNLLKKLAKNDWQIT